MGQGGERKLVLFSWLPKSCLYEHAHPLHTHSSVQEIGLKLPTADILEDPSATNPQKARRNAHTLSSYLWGTACLQQLQYHNSNTWGQARSILGVPSQPCRVHPGIFVVLTYQDRGRDLLMPHRKSIFKLWELASPW